MFLLDWVCASESGAYVHKLCTNNEEATGFDRMKIWVVVCLFVICLFLAFGAQVFAAVGHRLGYSLDINSDATLGRTYNYTFLFLGDKESVFRGGFGFSVGRTGLLRKKDESFSAFLDKYFGAAYVATQFFLVRGPDVSLYLKGNLGSIYSEEISDGTIRDYTHFYFGTGVGIEFGKMTFAELVYNNYGIMKFGTWKPNRDIPKHISLGLGLRF
jgi:hypothetical protein